MDTIPKPDYLRNVMFEVQKTQRVDLICIYLDHNNDRYSLHTLEARIRQAVVDVLQAEADQ